MRSRIAESIPEIEASAQQRHDAIQANLVGSAEPKFASDGTPENIVALGTLMMKEFTRTEAIEAKEWEQVKRDRIHHGTFHAKVTVSEMYVCSAARTAILFVLKHVVMITQVFLNHSCVSDDTP